MRGCQAHDAEKYALSSQRLGPLPLINHFIDKMGLVDILSRHVPTRDQRTRLRYSMGIGVLLRSILVEREPIYRQQETVDSYAPQAFGLTPETASCVGDDAIGRALDRLFDADRGTILTEVVVATAEAFDLSLTELHNDSTSIRFCGQYPAARGRSIRGKRAPFITRGYSKDHRPDLKQLLFILTTTKDGAVPVQFRCEDGNRNDSRTHEQTWDTLCRATGRKDFLYVADSKLCNGEALDYLHAKGGRFVCVMPRSRREDRHFREWIQTHEPVWVLAHDRPNPRHRYGPRDKWWVFRFPIPSVEGWPTVWVYSSLLRTRQDNTRRERIEATTEALVALNKKLSGPRPRKRSRQELQQRLELILRRHKVTRYIKAKIVKDAHPYYRQASPGRPGPETRYVRKTRHQWRIEWSIDEDSVEYDRKSDGMYPLLTNDRTLTDKQVLDAHKRQPAIEKRFEQTKTVFELAPVLLKNEGRVEAIFFVYFLSLLVQAVIERQIRLAMKREGIKDLPLYPEERPDPHPTAEQIFRLFGLVQRHVLSNDGREIRVFEHELTELQQQVLALLDVPQESYQRDA
jgi:transposase